MLQMGLNEPNVPGLAQATASDALCVCALDPCPRRIPGCKGGDLLPLPCGLDRHALGLRPEARTDDINPMLGAGGEPVPSINAYKTRRSGQS
jgi:hypothetical protein